MCDFKPIYPEASDAIRVLREQLSHTHPKSNEQPKSVIKDPQSQAVLDIMQRLVKQQG
jgi:hypothetical protein